jgi:hypothetical protein
MSKVHHVHEEKVHEEKVDLRSAHQKAEDEAAEAFAKLPLHHQVVQRLEPVVADLRHQERHNAPPSPGIIQRLEEVLGLARRLGDAVK